MSDAMTDIRNNKKLRDEIESLRQQLETERMRNVACSVVAMSDTPTSAKEARKMLPEYQSAALESVIRRVDECITLRQQLAEGQAALALKDEAIRGLSFGEDWNNGTHAKKYRPMLLKSLAIQPDDSALKAWLGEPVAYGVLEGRNIEDSAWGFIATWPEVCHEHINDMINDGLEDSAKNWRVISLYAPKGMK